MKENNALITYKPIKVNNILPIFPKSIPVPPEILPTIPLKISVVAFPSILGPTIVNIVLPIANIKTIIKAILYLDKYALLDEYLEQIGKQFGIKYAHMDNIDEYPVEIQNKLSDFIKLLDKEIPSIDKASTRKIEDIIRY